MRLRPMTRATRDGRKLLEPEVRDPGVVRRRRAGCRRNLRFERVHAATASVSAGEASLVGNPPSRPSGREVFLFCLRGSIDVGVSSPGFETAISRTSLRKGESTKDAYSDRKSVV